jgi:rod shape determining protein RodA
MSFRGGVHVDMPLVVSTVAICTLGVVNLYSATSAYIGSGRRAGLADVYVAQIYWIVVGILVAIMVAALDYRHYERLAYFFYAGGIATLCLVFVLGEGTRGATRWIDIGSFTFQPSEFMKILLILVVAKHLHDDPKTEPRTLVDLLPPLALIGLPVGLVMLQPDLGTALILLFTSVTMLAMTRINPRTLAFLTISGGLSTVLGWTYYMHDYQKARITSFLDPEKDTSGTGWHALQSRTAIGNGGLWGEGFMQGTQNQFGFLPDQFSDFPFSVFAEDWGLVGCIVLFAIYCFLCIWAIHIASVSKDRFGAALAIGVGAMMFWHTFANVGMASGILPVVGITLPLFSYGGSSVVAKMVGLGLLMNVSMRR